MKNYFPLLLFCVLALTALTMSSCKDEPNEEIQQYEITVINAPGGQVGIRVGGYAANKAAEGAEVTLTATPDEGYTFSHWTVENGSVTLSGNPATFAMPAKNVSVRAEFAEEIEEVSNVYDKMIDPGFMFYCQEIGKFDTDGDGILSLEEAQAVTEINVNEWYKVSGERIGSLAGIEYFTSLTSLSCYGNAIYELDLSNNTELTYLHVGTNQLDKLDVTKNTKLVELYVSRNLITGIDLSKCPELTKFQCNQCIELASIDVSNNPKLTHFSAQSCPKLTALDLSKNTALIDVRCYDGNLTTLDVSNSTGLEVLHCFDNQIAVLDVSKCAALQYFDCRGNQLTSLDVSKATSLIYFMCYKNRMTTLDASNMAQPTDYSLGCGVQTTDGTTPQIIKLTLSEAQKPHWQVSMVPYQDMNADVELQGGSPDVLQIMKDPIFRAYCEQFDTDHDGKLSLEEAAAVTEIIVPKMGISSIDGLRFMTGLRKLVCNNNNLTSLNVKYNPELTELTCNNNQLEELLLWSSYGGRKLQTLNCQFNELPELSLAGCYNIITVNSQNNKIASINLNNTKLMTSLNCSNNLLTSLSLHDSHSINMIFCSFNQLTKIDYLANKVYLTSLMCNNNPMTSLDISGCTSLMGVMAYENRLSELNASDMASPNGYNLFCGNQTFDGTTAQTLKLTLRAEQKPYWESAMKDSFMNGNIVLAD